MIRGLYMACDTSSQNNLPATAFIHRLTLVKAPDKARKKHD